MANGTAFLTLPAEHCQASLAGLLAPVMGEGYPIVIARGADEEQVIMLPGWQSGIAASVGNETTQDFAQCPAAERFIGKFNKENAPRLSGGQRTELTDHPIRQSAHL